MADIELVIKIPEEIYDGYMNYTENYVDFMFFGSEEKIVRAIRNGTPLPKGHGRLIILSEDAVRREQRDVSFSCQKWISEVGLSHATVAIIEADKEI